MIGRFSQTNSMVFPDRTMGMNRYMYVEGNLVKLGDDSVHILSTAQSLTELDAAYATVKKVTSTQLGDAGQFNDLTLYISVIAAVAHLEKQPNDGSQSVHDNNCFYLAVRRNR